MALAGEINDWTPGLVMARSGGSPSVFALADEILHLREIDQRDLDARPRDELVELVDGGVRVTSGS